MIREIELSEIPEDLQRRAQREGAHVLTTLKRRTYWFGYELEGRIVGFGGLLVLGPRSVRLRSAYVEPEHRGRGIGSELADFRIAVARELGAKRIDVRAWERRFWLGRGFRIEREFRGTTDLVLDL